MREAPQLRLFDGVGRGLSAAAAAAPSSAPAARTMALVPRSAPSGLAPVVSLSIARQRLRGVRSYRDVYQALEQEPVA